MNVVTNWTLPVAVMENYRSVNALVGKLVCGALYTILACALKA